MKNCFIEADPKNNQGNESTGFGHYDLTLALLMDLERQGYGAIFTFCDSDWRF